MRRNIRGKITRIILSLILIALGFKLSADAIREPVMDSAKHSAKAEAERIIYSVFAEEFEKLSVKGETFTDIRRAENGDLLSVEVKTPILSDFSFKVAIRALEALRESAVEPFKLSIGSLSGNPYLAGKAPFIPFRIETGKTIHTEIKSDFISAGINMALHRLNLILTADITIFMGRYSENQTVSVSAPLSETVIIGEVPESFSDLSFLSRNFELEK